MINLPAPACEYCTNRKDIKAEDALIEKPAFLVLMVKGVSMETGISFHGLQCMIKWLKDNKDKVPK